MSVADLEIQGDLSYMRQKDWFDPSQNEDRKVGIVGVGGIGSPTALALAKLGISNFTLIDPDTVEAHNLPNQMFPWQDWLGQGKVHAVNSVIQEFSPAQNVTTIEAKLGDVDPREFGDVCIAALDSMEARTELFEKLKYALGTQLVLDGRLDQENIVLYAYRPCDPESRKFYEATLYSDDEAKDTSCTRQSIIDVGFSVASLITRAVRRFYADEPVEKVVYWDQQRLTIYKGEETV